MGDNKLGKPSAKARPTNHISVDCPARRKANRFDVGLITKTIQELRCLRSKCERSFLTPAHSAIWVGNLLGDEAYLFHLSRRSVSLGVMVGLFWAFTPIPFQMLPAAITAWIIRANLPLSVALVWISNPVTVPPLLLIAYGIGSWILTRRSYHLRPASWTG